MPDTEITVVRSGGSLNLLIRAPMTDLLLALPPGSTREMKAPRTRQIALRSYFLAHSMVLDAEGKRLPLRFGDVRLHQSRSPDRGTYVEVETTATVPVADEKAVGLAYDGILQRIANHRAWVRTNTGRYIGVFQYDLTSKRAMPRVLELPAGSL